VLGATAPHQSPSSRSAQARDFSTCAWDISDRRTPDGYVRAAPSCSVRGENDALDRIRREQDEVAELYDDFVRRGDGVAVALSAAMINAFADLVRARGPRVLWSMRVAVLDIGPIISSGSGSGLSGSLSRRR
jgi:hypothetical protein